MRTLQKLVKSIGAPKSKSKGSTTNSKAVTKSPTSAGAGDPGLAKTKAFSFSKGPTTKGVTKSPISTSADEPGLSKTPTSKKTVSFSKGPSSNSKTQTANTPVDGSSGSSSKSGSSSQSRTITAVSSGQEAMKILTSGKRSKVTDLTGIVDRDEHQYIGGGAFGDVYKGVWKDSDTSARARAKSEHPEVVVKVLRSMGKVDAKALARRLRELRRELTVWQTLDHENIVPFVGITLISGLLPSIVSAWMPQGTLRSFIAKKSANKRHEIAIDVAEGLKYLHTLKPPIIHGDLKADNVLIDAHGTARLCDFGLSRMLEETTLWRTSATSAPGTVRWKSPELLSGQRKTVSVEADVYAYGMTCFEIFTGEVPFQQYRNDWMVMRAVLDRREVPQRPLTNSRRAMVTDPLWELWKECWNAEAGVRPTADEAVEKMKGIKLGAGSSKSKSKSKSKSEDLLGHGPNALSKGQGSPSPLGMKVAEEEIGEEDEEEDDQSQQEGFPSTQSLSLTTSGPGKSSDTSWTSYELRSRSIPRWTQARDDRVSFFQAPAPIDRLSNEILWAIFRYNMGSPGPHDQLQLQLVCRRWRRVVQSNRTSLTLASPGVSIIA